MPRGAFPAVRSRTGKKQMVAYLSPAQADAAKTKSRTDSKTVQEVLGEAVNAVFVFHKREAPLLAGHGRIVRRVNGRAAVRSTDRNPACRSGRVAVGGWFPHEQVDVVTAFAAELGVSIQAFVEFGMRLVTDIKPDGDGWRIAAGEADATQSVGRPRGRPAAFGVTRRIKADPMDAAVNAAVASAMDRMLSTIPDKAGKTPKPRVRRQVAA